jgi:sulfate adenylyltransferase subunit 2
MYEFRDEFVKSIGANLIVERNEPWIDKGAHPTTFGIDKCCSYLKTQGLLEAIRRHGFDAAFGGARRDEEKSRAKERIFSLRDEFGQWDPKNQRPELWNIYNARINEQQGVRVFPLSNWTEQDIWQYIKLEDIPIVPLYYARKRKVIERNKIIVPVENVEVAMGKGNEDKLSDYKVHEISCRFRSLGCIPCTGAIPSEAKNIDDIIAEVAAARKSERENRVIDLTSDSSMEQKKKEGYF